MNENITKTLFLVDLTMDEVAGIVARPPAVVLLPIGSVEPHGPHLPLDTDLRISAGACKSAALELRARGVSTYIAPGISYSVTEFSKKFPGAVGIDARTLTATLKSVADGLLEGGWTHVCLVNNHFEPDNDAAVRSSISHLDRDCVSLACPLNPRWGRTLSAEFKSGACHAGQYETSLMLAAGVPVRSIYRELPSLECSLSDEIRKGRKTFTEMGMDRAYTGSPAGATKEEGEDMFRLLRDMIVAEVTQALEKS